MKNQFRLSLRRPAIWSAVWVVVIVLAAIRFGSAYVPFALLLGVVLIGALFWGNAGPGLVRTIEAQSSGLVVQQLLGGTEQIPWQDMTELALVHRADLMGLYPLLRLDTRSRGRVFLPYYLLDDPAGLKAQIISRTRMRLAPVAGATTIERWIRVESTQGER